MHKAVRKVKNLPPTNGYHFKHTGHYIFGFKEMKKLQREGKLCDIIITVEQEVFHGHKLVFASVSRYFSYLFTGKDEDICKAEMYIDDISPASFQSILQFFYTGEIIITVANVEDLLFASKKFKIDTLEAACGEAMPELLNPTTWIQIKAIAGALNSKEMYLKCHAYALQHFTDIVKTDKFLQLPIHEVADLIADDSLVVPSDEEVYSAVLKWVKYDLTNRGPLLYQLMKYVKLPLLDKTYFANNVTREPLMRDNFECTKLLLEATEYHSGIPCVQPSTRTTPRTHVKAPNSYIFVTGGSTSTILTIHNLNHLSQAMSECEVYNHSTNSWHSISPMQNRRMAHGLIGCRDLLYAFGGWNQQAVSTVEYYSPLNDSWTVTTSLPCERYGHGICSIDGEIYICGGIDKSKRFLNSVEKFDPVTSAYARSPAMKSNRAQFNVAVADNRIYAIGGFNTGGSLNSMEIFDPREAKWSDAPFLNTGMRPSGVAVLDGCIYTYQTSQSGYRNAISHKISYQRFDIRRNRWEPMNNMYTENVDLKNPVRCVHIMGSSINSIKKINPVSNNEIIMPRMLLDRYCFSATAMD